VERRISSGIAGKERRVVEEFQRMQYSKKLIEHFEHPRNVGSFEDNEENVGTGLIGSPACGDVMKFQIKVNPETDTVIDARFKTFGCGSAIASGSLITEWVKGKTLDQALQVQNRDIARSEEHTSELQSLS
jgi:nitrogen fixation NifU-like protein